MSETSIIAIILSLVAVGGTLIGTWLGRLLERSNEDRKWRRERCLEAYTEVFNSCQNLVFESDKAYRIECGSLEHHKQVEVMIMKILELSQTNDKAALLGSEYAFKMLGELINHCSSEIALKSINCPKLPESEWRKIRSTDFTAILINSRNAARDDLKIYPKFYSIPELSLIIKSLDELQEDLSKGSISSDDKEQRINEIRKKIKNRK